MIWLIRSVQRSYLLLKENEIQASGQSAGMIVYIRECSQGSMRNLLSVENESKYLIIQVCLDMVSWCEHQASDASCEVGPVRHAKRASAHVAHPGSAQFAELLGTRFECRDDCQHLTSTLH
jgi:hypothetical protein